MLDEVIEELATSQPVVEYCSEYDANYIRDNFEPRNLEVTADKNVCIPFPYYFSSFSLFSIKSRNLSFSGQMHLKYPLYGTGSSAVTYYSESIKKTGPVSYLIFLATL